MADLIFSRSLYTEDAVRAAAAAYAEVCPIAIETRNDDVIARFPADGVDPSIVDSFANHALFETIVSRKTS
jgi:hypothetical protein